MEASTVAKFKEQDFRFWQLMIAGSVAGSVKHITMFPVHTMNRRMLLRSYSQKPVGVQQALCSVIQSEGPSALYRGISSMRLGATGLHHAFYFSFYEVSKKFLSTGNTNYLAVHAVSGVFTAVSSRAISAPVDVVTLRLLHGNRYYQGVWDCIKRVIREEGISAFYASHRTVIPRNAYYNAIHFATYEVAKRRLKEISQGRHGWLVHATAGATAGGLATALTWPLVVIALVPAQPTDTSQRARVSFSRVLISIVKYEGFMALFRGCLPNILINAPATAICWSTYETVKLFYQDRNADSSMA